MRAALAVALASAVGLSVAVPSGERTAIDVIATGVARPTQLVLQGQSLIILSPSLANNAVGELHQVDLRGTLPADLSRQSGVRIPRVDPAMLTLGSLVSAGPGVLIAGEENGTRIWQLDREAHATLLAKGFRRLGGGTTLAVDERGRLIVVDYADASAAERDESLPPGLEQLREEEYRGALVFRVALGSGARLPRRAADLAPLFPRAYRPEHGKILAGQRIVSVATHGRDDLVLLTSQGDLYRGGTDGVMTPFARLPRGQYNRISMATANDGTVFVAGGFHVGDVFRVSPDGAVSTVVSGLADPEGIAVDADGALYVAESSLHRILRLRAL